MSDPYGARDELRRRIAAKLRLDHNLTDQDCEHAAQLVAAMFYTVDDDWDYADITPMSYHGRQWLENRYLVARMPVQGIAFERPVDRTVIEVTP